MKIMMDNLAQERVQSEKQMADMIDAIKNMPPPQGTLLSSSSSLLLSSSWTLPHRFSSVFCYFVMRRLLSVVWYVKLSIGKLVRYAMFTITARKKKNAVLSEKRNEILGPMLLTLCFDFRNEIIRIICSLVVEVVVVVVVVVLVVIVVLVVVGVLWRLSLVSSLKVFLIFFSYCGRWRRLFDHVALHL